MRWLASEHRRPRPLEASIRCVEEARAMFRRPKGPSQVRIKLVTLFQDLVWLRNQNSHRAPWKRDLARRVVELLHPCIEELLECDELRAGLNLTVRDQTGKGVDLTGCLPIAKRGSSSFWLGGTVCCGGERSVDLQGLFVVAACRRCHRLDLMQLDALGSWYSSSASPLYSCTRCGAVFKAPFWARLLRHRLEEASETTPWVDLYRRSHRVASGRPVRLSFVVFNSLDETIEDVAVDVDPPPDVDQIDRGEDMRVERSLPPHKRASVEVQLKPNRPGMHVIKPSLAWSRNGERCRLALDEITLDIFREWHAHGLVGRDQHQEALRRGLAQATMDMGSLVVVEGQQGVGRTALVDTFLNELPQDVIALRSKCGPHEPQPTHPLVELVLKYARYYHHVEPWQLTTTATPDILLFAGDLIEAIELVTDQMEYDIPEVRAFRDHEHPDGGGLRESEVQLSAVALLRFFDAISINRAALVLLIEDVDLAHPRTLELIQFLASSVQKRRTLLVLTTSPVGRIAPKERKTRIQELVDSTSHHLVLQPLNRQQVFEYINRVFPRNAFGPGFRERIWETTKGMPFYLTQTLESLMATGLLEEKEQGWVCTVEPERIDVPRQVAKVIEARLRALPENYLEVVKHAAVLGQRFPTRLLEGAMRERQGQDLSRREQHELLSMLGKLDQTYQIIRNAGTEREFSHHRLWDVAYYQLSCDERVLLHDCVVAHLEKEPPSLERDIRIADHAIAARRVEKAVRYTVSVSEQLFELSKFSKACALLDRAVKLGGQENLPRPLVRQLLRLAAEALRRTGRPGEAIVLDERTIALAREAGDAVQMVEGLRRKARCLVGLGDNQGAQRVLAEAAEAAAHAGLGRQEAEILASRATVLCAMHRNDEAAQINRRCLELCDRYPGTDRSKAHCLLTVARRALEEGDLEAALQRANDARALYRKIGDDRGQARASYALSFSLEARGDLPAATKAARTALRLREETDDLIEAAKANLRLGELLIRIGQIQDAREHIARALSFWEPIGNQSRLADSLLAMARLEFEIDNAERAKKLALRAGTVFRETGECVALARAHATVLKAMNRQGDRDEIKRHSDLAWREVDREVEAGAYLEFVIAQAAASRYLGRFDNATNLLEEERPRLDELRSPLLRGRWLFEHANILRGKGELPASVDAARAATERFQESGDVLLACQSRTMLATTLVDLGRHDQARELLEPLAVECDELNDPLGRAICLQELGRIAAAGGDTVQARELYNESRGIRVGLEDWQGVSRIETLLSELPGAG
jgi:tetratricopeptide (TPR) repeat protein